MAEKETSTRFARGLLTTPFKNGTLYFNNSVNRGGLVIHATVQTITTAALAIVMR